MQWIVISILLRDRQQLGHMTFPNSWLDFSGCEVVLQQDFTMSTLSASIPVAQLYVVPLQLLTKLALPLITLYRDVLL